MFEVEAQLIERNVCIICSFSNAVTNFYELNKNISVSSI